LEVTLTKVVQIENLNSAISVCLESSELKFTSDSAIRFSESEFQAPNFNCNKIFETPNKNFHKIWFTPKESFFWGENYDWVSYHVPNMWLSDTPTRIVQLYGGQLKTKEDAQTCIEFEKVSKFQSFEVSKGVF
jgi:hypothetical protein